MASTNKLLPCYLVVGEEEVKSKNAVTRIKKYVSSDMAAFDLDEIFYTSETTAFDVVSSCQMFPFGGDRRVVIFYADSKIRKEVSDPIAEYLSNPNPQCTLCIVAKSMDKRSKLYKAIKKLDASAIIDCEPMKKWELPNFVMKLASANGKQINKFTAEELVVRVGESESLLKREVETLCILIGNKPEIDIEDVKTHVAWTADIKPWDVVDAICARNTSRVLELYSRVEKPQQAQIVWLFWIEGRFRELLCAKHCMKDYGSNLGYELTQAYGQTTKTGKKRPYKQDWQLKSHMSFASNFTEKELEDNLKACLECEKGLKGGSDNKDICFTNFLIFITTPTNSHH